MEHENDPFILNWLELDIRPSVYVVELLSLSSIFVIYINLEVYFLSGVVT